MKLGPLGLGDVTSPECLYAAGEARRIAPINRPANFPTVKAVATRARRNLATLDEKTKEIVERLTRLIGEGRDYDEDTEAMIVAKGIIESLSERVGELERGVRALLPHLHLGHEPIVSDCLLRSRSEQMRLDADREAKYETAVRNLRALLSKQEEQKS